MLNVYANILPLNNIQRILASLQVFVELTKYVPREGIVARILSHAERRERKNTRFLLQTVRREARNTVSWPKPFGGKLETLFPDPNYSAARYRGAILAPRGAAGRKITRFLSHAEPREGKSRDSCPMRSRGKELSHDSCPMRNCGKELSHDSCLSRTAASWRQRTILPHGDSWHAFRGKMTGRASTKSRNA